MGLTYEEQEICINATRDEDMATAYCSDRTWITKLDKLVQNSPNLFKVVAEDENGKTYEFPKKLISIRSSFVKREMTEEQRRAAAERLKKARNNKVTQSNEI